MKIRHTEEKDFARILAIYASARAFMKEHGNPNQWGPRNWPPEALLREDIAKRRENHILEAVRSQGKGLNHADVLEFVHHDSGKPVGLAENHPAGRGVHGFLPILPRRADALP